MKVCYGVGLLVEDWPTEEYQTLPCSVCGKEGRFRYAPLDGRDPCGTALPYEASRWRCTEHQHYDSTVEGWNGEWDDYFPHEPCK